MRKTWWIHLALILVIPGLLFTASCSKKVVQSDATAAEQQQAASEAGEEEAMKGQAAMTEDEKAAAMQQIQDDAAAREAEAAQLAFENEHVYFEFDSAQLLPAGQDILVRKADWLRNNGMASAIIEGHCDERGTAEYNLALGERRANAAKNFLVDLGISGSRLTTISYGEERPVDLGSNEEAWAKNRRSQFVIQ